MNMQTILGEQFTGKTLTEGESQFTTDFENFVIDICAGGNTEEANEILSEILKVKTVKHLELPHREANMKCMSMEELYRAKAELDELQGRLTIMNIASAHDILKNLDVCTEEFHNKFMDIILEIQRDITNELADRKGKVRKSSNSIYGRAIQELNNLETITGVVSAIISANDIIDISSNDNDKELKISIALNNDLLKNLEPEKKEVIKKNMEHAEKIVKDLSKITGTTNEFVTKWGNIILRVCKALDN